MNKFIAGALAGLLIGVGGTWYFSRHTAEHESEAKPAETEKHEAGLHLTHEQQASAGIVVAKPEPAELKPETRAFGRVLDATPLATLLAEIEMARASLNATSNEFTRLKALGENASVRALETVEAAVKRDHAMAESAQTRLIAGWGNALATRPDLAAFVHSLIAQEFALIRVDIPAGETFAGSPKSVRIAPLTGDDSSREAEVIGPAPAADPQAQGLAFLVLVRDHAPAPGTALAAWLAGAESAQKGFRLPRTAIVQFEGEMFVFIQTGDEAFVRKRVETAASQREGSFIRSGLAADDRVVTVGAQQLLSEEFKGAGAEK